MACFVEEVKLGVGEHFGNPHQLLNFTGIIHWGYYHGWILVMYVTLGESKTSYSGNIRGSYLRPSSYTLSIRAKC